MAGGKDHNCVGLHRYITCVPKEGVTIEVPIPPYEKQYWFNRLQAQVATIRQAQTDSRAKLDALLPAILDRAFKGEL